MRDTLEDVWRGPVLGVVLSLLGCTSFPVIEAGVCGNEVLEKDQGEDCDTYPHEELGNTCRAPGEVGACHYDCRPKADGALVPCPDDMGCTADGICRAPNGEFSGAVKLASGVSSWLSSADFDGDGRQDIISTEAANELSEARFRIHYFGPSSTLEESVTFPRVVSRPLARKLVGNDSADDLVFSNGLIGMLPGRADRAWVPASFSSYVLPGTRLRAVPVRADGVGGSIGLAVFSDLDEGLGVYVPSSELKLKSTASLARNPDELAGQPTAGDLFPGPDSPCSEVVYAFQGDDSVHVLDLCQQGVAPPGDEVVWRIPALEHVVRLPQGLPVDSAPFAADIDSDGHQDIVIGSGGLAFVAYGDGTTLEPEATPLSLVDQLDGTTSRVPAPLAVGDLTGDGVADFVLPIGLRASHVSPIDGQTRYVTSYKNYSKPWSTAVLADFNGNGLLDVVAGTTGEPGLSFLSGSGAPIPVFSHLNTQGPVQFLTAGDFDGDRLADAAYVQGGPPNGDSDTLVVAFGQRDGVPLPGAPIAGVAEVQQLGSADQTNIDSVFVVAHDHLGGVTRSKFTLFDGNSDRLPFAPYSLVTFSRNGGLHDSVARVLSLGAFTAPMANDVFVLAGEENDPLIWSMWVVPDIGGGGEPPRRLVPDAVPEDALALTLNREGGQLSAASLAADLDGDEYDEALVLMQKGGMGEGCYLMTFDVDLDAGADGQTSAAISRGLVTFDEPCRSPEISGVDLNADGAVDLLVLIGDALAGPRQLRLLFNDGRGGFSLAESTLISAGEHDIRAFGVFAPTALPPDAPLPMRIAFVTDDALYVAQNEPRGRAFDLVRRIQDFSDASGVVITDPAGDGVQDLAVTDAAGLWLVAAELE